MQLLVEIQPKTTVARHTHPGVETVVVLEGSGEAIEDGKPPVEVAPGATWQHLAGVPHGGRYGPRGAKFVATLSVEKGKPVTSPA